MSQPGTRQARVKAREAFPRRPARWHAWRRWTATVSTAVLAIGLSTLAAPSAGASPSDSSTAAARFLSGTLLTSAGTLDSMVALAGATAVNNGSATPVTESSELNATALSAFTVSPPGGVVLPLGDFIALGVANQFAQASDNGVSRAASGAVDDSGVVDVGGTGAFPSSATIDIRSLLDTVTVPASVLSAASVTARRVTGIAALTAADSIAEQCADLSNPANCRDYTIDSATLDVHSPLVGDVITGATTAAGTVDTAVQGLSGGIVSGLLTGVTNSLGLLDGLVPGLSVVSDDLSVDIESSLASTIAGSITTTRSQNGVTLDLAAGTVTVDLGQVIGGLNDRDPNTPLLDAAVLSSITTSLTTLIGQVATQLTGLLNDALDAATVTISGGVCLLEVAGACTAGLDISYAGTLGDLLDGTQPLTVSGSGLLAVPGLTPLLGDVVGNLLAGVTDGLTTGLEGIDSTITTAVSNLTDPLSNQLTPALTAIGMVLGLTLNVQDSPASAPYTEVALRASVLGGSATTIDLGKASVGPNTDALDVTATGLTPDHGPAVGGTSVTITGSGFVPGTTSVDFGGTTVPAAVVSVSSGTSLTVTSPAHIPGDVPVTVSNGPGLTSSPGLSFTYDQVPAPVIAAPADGATTGPSPTISGTGVPGDTITVTDGTDRVCTATVQPDNTWTCIPDRPLAPGDHTITATQSDADGNPSAPSEPVTFTATAAPSAPIDLTALAGDRYIELTWTAPTDSGGLPISGYNVFIGTSPGGESPTRINPVLLPGLGYTVSGLTNGTTYYFTVEAVNAQGSSEPSNEASGTPMAGGCDSGFWDVPSTNVFCFDIEWLHDNGITRGYEHGDQGYHPGAPFTRQAMAAFVYRQLNPGQPDPICETGPFWDVSISSEFCGEIAWLKEHGITNGYADGDEGFHPGAAVSRQAMAAFMFRMNNLTAPDPTCQDRPFPDVSDANQFCGDIEWLRDQGITHGYTSDGLFHASALISRQAMAAFVHRMVTSVQ